MSPEWDRLPLLPLRCILDHLSVEDALAATSTCLHWRQAMLLYEGKSDIITLDVTNIERNLFMTRLFRKHARKLRVFLNGNEEQLNKFLTYILPQFFETKHLEEMVFIGTIYYMRPNALLPNARLKRIITESLVFKHSNFLQKLAFLGCEISAVEDKDRYVHKQVEYYSKPLSFGCVTTPADAVLSRSNVQMMMFSTLQHIVFDYDLVSTEALETLSQLSNLTQITLNVIFKLAMSLPLVDWRRVHASFNKGLDVAVNLIGVPFRKFRMVMLSVFVDGMGLTSLKALFCCTLYIPLLNRVCYLYNGTLRELVWVDTPHTGHETTRAIRAKTEQQVLMAEVYNQINPFILLCWQCVNLRRLVIHGYWIWQYDLLGFVRLRRSLLVEVSSLYANQGRFGFRSLDAECVLRVLHHDTPPALDNSYIQEVNRFTDYEWRPCPWRRLHPGLRVYGTPLHRADYIFNEVLMPVM